MSDIGNLTRPINTQVAVQPAISETRPTLVFASTESCVPCMFAKPLVRKLAIQADGALDLVEIDADTAPHFVAAHAIGRFPQLLAFASGRLTERSIGYDSDEAIVSFVERALHVQLPPPLPAREQLFAEGMASARSRFDAAMAAANDVVAPHIRAVEPALHDLEQRLAGDITAGRLTAREAGQVRCTEQACLFKPFQDKIADLARAQAIAMAAFEETATACVTAYARG